MKYPLYAITGGKSGIKSLISIHGPYNVGIILILPYLKRHDVTKIAPSGVSEAYSSLVTEGRPLSELQVGPEFPGATPQIV